MDEIKKIKTMIRNYKKNMEAITDGFSGNYYIAEDYLHDLTCVLRSLQKHLLAAQEINGVEEIAQQRVQTQLEEADRVRRIVYVNCDVLI